MNRITFSTFLSVFVALVSNGAQQQFGISSLRETNASALHANSYFEVVVGTNGNSTNRISRRISPPNMFSNQTYSGTSTFTNAGGTAPMVFGNPNTGTTRTNFVINHGAAPYAFETSSNDFFFADHLAQLVIMGFTRALGELHLADSILVIDTLNGDSVFTGSLQADGFIAGDGTPGASATVSGLVFNDGLYASGSFSGGSATNAISEIRSNNVVVLTGVVILETSNGPHGNVNFTHTPFGTKDVMYANVSQSVTSGMHTAILNLQGGTNGLNGRVTALEGGAGGNFVLRTNGTHYGDLVLATDEADGATNTPSLLVTVAHADFSTSIAMGIGGALWGFNATSNQFDITPKISAEDSFLTFTRHNDFLNLTGAAVRIQAHAVSLPLVPGSNITGGAFVQRIEGTTNIRFAPLLGPSVAAQLPIKMGSALNDHLTNSPSVTIASDGRFTAIGSDALTSGSLSITGAIPGGLRFSLGTNTAISQTTNFALNFDAGQKQYIEMSAAVHFAHATNHFAATNKAVRTLIRNVSGSSLTLTWPTTWKTFGAHTTNNMVIPNGKRVLAMAESDDEFPTNILFAVSVSN